MHMLAHRHPELPVLSVDSPQARAGHSCGHVATQRAPQTDTHSDRRGLASELATLDPGAGRR